MNNYTEQLQDAMFSLWGEDDFVDNYAEVTLAFLNARESFYTFGEALSKFIVEVCNVDSSIDLIAYIKKCAKENRVPIEAIAKDNRTLKGWFNDNKKAGSRRQMFALAFALQLSVKQTQELFHKVYLDRAFDCRNPEEMIYFYSMNQGYEWLRAQQLVSCLAEDVDECANGVTLPTSVIQGDLEQMSNDAEVLSYISEQRYNIRKKNITAHRMQDELVAETREYAIEEATEYKGADGSIKRKEEYFGHDVKSFGFLYHVILNHSPSGKKGTVTLFTNKNKDRLPRAIHQCFPEVKSFTDQEISYEEMRKLLILLFSYKYWHLCNKQKLDSDLDDYTAMMNDMLFQAGMPELYPGNPYDWMFLYCTLQDNSLDCFRELISIVLE